MYRQTIKNLTIQNCDKIIKCLTNGGHAGTIADLVTDATMTVLEAEKNRREKRRINVSADVDLLTEQYDKKGRRRYRLAAIDDEPVMLPDKEGFWTPADDPIATAANERSQ